jgi:hypothetical protein
MKKIYRDDKNKKIYGTHDGMTYLFIGDGKWESRLHHPPLDDMVELSDITWGLLHYSFIYAIQQIGNKNKKA